MKSDLRNNPQRSLGRYWLAMSDAAAFTLVRSALAIAAKLRAALAEQVHVAPPLSGPELAVALMTAADAAWGKGKAAHLMAELADLKGVDCQARAKAWTLLRDAIAELPTGLWALEKLPMRRELLDELERQANVARAELPPLPSKLELREQQWRETALALRAAASR